MTNKTTNFQWMIESSEFLNQLPIGLFVIDSDFIVYIWNRIMVKWLGIRTDEILHHTINEFFPNFNRLRSSGLFEPVFQAGSPLFLSHQLHNNLFSQERRAQRSFNVSVTALLDPHHKNDYAVFTLQDVSDLFYQIEQNKMMHEEALLEIEHRKQIEKKLLDVNKELEGLSRTDPLTGLSNRRDLLEKINYEYKRSARNRQPICIIIGDIDNFKKINDNHGHDCGDYVLIAVTQCLKSHLRGEDSIARWGGEEFLIMLPGSDLKQAHLTAERICKSIADNTYQFKGKYHSVTMTFGMACCLKPEQLPINQLIANADQALIKGKNSGKNMVVISDMDLSD